MKGYLRIATIFVLMAIIIAAPAEEQTEETKKCPDICTLELGKVCGYDGNCYKEYPNKCSYDAEKCSKKSSLETVDMSLCDTAEKDNHPNYKTCDE